MHIMTADINTRFHFSNHILVRLQVSWYRLPASVELPTRPATLSGLWCRSQPSDCFLSVRHTAWTCWHVSCHHSPPQSYSLSVTGLYVTRSGCLLYFSSLSQVLHFSLVLKPNSPIWFCLFYCYSELNWQQSNAVQLSGDGRYCCCRCCYYYYYYYYC